MADPAALLLAERRVLMAVVNAADVFANEDPLAMQDPAVGGYAEYVALIRSLLAWDAFNRNNPDLPSTSEDLAAFDRWMAAPDA